jgi:hypothetical protein
LNLRKVRALHEPVPKGTIPAGKQPIGRPFHKRSQQSSKPGFSGWVSELKAENSEMAMNVSKHVGFLKGKSNIFLKQQFDYSSTR